MHKHKSSILIIFSILSAVVVVLSFYALITSKKNQTSTNNTGLIQIVAGENFWGSLVAQIGGDKVKVVSIVSDPNADPHEYEVNNNDARLFADANYVILNGAGYDSWGNKLLSGNPNNNRRTLIISNLLNKKDGDNPHFWYNPTYVNQVDAQIENNLIAISPSNKLYFQEQYQILQQSLSIYQAKILKIKHQFSGVRVAATEDVFSYLAQATGLKLISPPAFTQAVSEGNDPPINSVVDFEQQLQSGQIKVLVYNMQTITPLTNNIKALAIKMNIPVIGVTETIQPSNLTFQAWMNSELINLQTALNTLTN
jgi:zinc/manganese transport system substrate-binding protein